MPRGFHPPVPVCPYAMMVLLYPDIEANTPSAGERDDWLSTRMKTAHERLTWMILRYDSHAVTSSIIHMRI